jgi:hypothetical protein
MKEVSKREMTEECNRAIAETGNALVQRSKARAPFIEGDLKASIIFFIGSRGLIGRVGFDGQEVSRRGGASSHRHPHVYGRFVHNGSKKNIPPNKFIAETAETMLSFYIAALGRAGQRLESSLASGG